MTPTITLSTDRPLCPAGSHRLTLVEVVLKEVDGYRDDGPTTRLLWRFHTAALDERGRPYEVVVFTGTSYGHAQARLTWLLDMLLPDLTPQSVLDLDLGALIGRQYEAFVRHAANQRDPNRKHAEIVSLQPAVG